jgi:hypothetical protein
MSIIQIPEPQKAAVKGASGAWVTVGSMQTAPEITTAPMPTATLMCPTDLSDSEYTEHQFECDMIKAGPKLDDLAAQALEEHKAQRTRKFPE